MRRTKDEIRRAKELEEYRKQEQLTNDKVAELLAMDDYTKVLLPTDTRCKVCGSQYGLPRVDSWLEEFFCMNPKCTCRADYYEGLTTYEEDSVFDKVEHLAHVLVSNPPLSQETIDQITKKYEDAMWRPQLGELIFYWGFNPKYEQIDVCSRTFNGELLDLYLIDNENCFRTIEDCTKKIVKKKMLDKKRKNHFKHLMPTEGSDK